jgi:hypothetical protein
MASPFQRQALNRKLTYAALILVLFTVAYVWRSKEFSVFGHEVRGVDAQARDLSIREQSRGEVNLLGAIVRLSTMGLRGVATCIEWIHAMDAQKKNQWNELELHVHILTRLQPHFITPWLFQSWNLSYNVSVESDRVNDKYFYISRGINLLAEGERQNRDNPDMRWSIGFFLQHKIGQSDETNVLRSLSQLSMIPPNERDPGRFWTKGDGGRQEINLSELEDFCKGHPQLVRRLREGMRRERKSEQLRQFRCERAEDLVQFLEDNFRVPSLWVDSLPSEKGYWKPKQDKEKPLADRFPVLPPRHETSRPFQQPPDLTALTDESKLLDEHDAYQVARAWYSYSQEPLPAPADMPGQSKPIENRVYQRLNRHMVTVIFRDYPAQAQRFTAERLQDEGWYDVSGWAVPDDWFPGDRFPDGEPAVVGATRAWGREAWQLTSELWRRFGVDNHMLLDPAEQNRMEQRARNFAIKKHLTDASPPPMLREDELDAEATEELKAWMFLRSLAQTKHLCNFDYHYNRANVEAMEETIRARKIFFDALDAARLRNDEAEALRKYLDPAAMKSWRNILLTNKIFRSDSLMQEQTFEYQLRFVDLYSRLGGAAFKSQAAGMLLIPSVDYPFGGVCPIGLTFWLNTFLEKESDNPPLGEQPKQKNNNEKQPRFKMNWDNPLLGGPFDVMDEDGFPLIPEATREQVLKRFFPALFTGSQQGGAPPPPPAPTKTG